MTFSTSFLLGLFIGSVAVILFWLRRRARYRCLVKTLGNIAFHPVRYSSERRYMKWFKLFPCEGEALLSCDTDLLNLWRFSKSGDLEKITLSRDNCAFIGNPNSIQNGYLSWIRCSTTDSNIYVTAETGPFVFGSHLQTSSLFSRIQSYTEQRAAANP